ncbi:hypothetical protein [Nocardioides sp.]|uniref:hypothetical protein n=1 Tax=Nocardioides sp. TaxID=35761 RepID=UPI003517AC13
MKDLRRLIVAVVVGSFSLAALLGIVTLLSPGAFGETELQVLLTTVIAGVEATVVLCLLSLTGHRFAPIGVVGGVSSAIATGCALLFTWADFGSDPLFEAVEKTFGVTAILALTAAQLALLISRVLRPEVSEGLRALLGASALAASLVAAMTIGPVLTGSDPGDDYWRVLGIVAILDALGSVVLIALGAFGRARQRAAAGGGGAGSGDAVSLSEAQLLLLERVARERGTTSSEVLDRALRALVDHRVR